jgi:hypothetical protein
MTNVNDNTALKQKCQKCNNYINDLISYYLEPYGGPFCQKCYYNMRLFDSLKLKPLNMGFLG